MTVRVQAVYEAEILRRISPKVFWPTPAVQSAFIRLRRRRERPGGDVAHALAVLVRHGFGQRRKQLRTSLKPVLGARLEEYLAGVGAEVTQRAESLSVEQWMRLAERTASSGR
jgi:16S rRNA (adenine1518-N6/adenine1519-N6)-dimethyltransferase